jgi:hypothetical protein
MSLGPPPDLSLRAESLSCTLSEVEGAAKGRRSNLQGTIISSSGDCFVAPLLAMTPLNAYDLAIQQEQVGVY